MRQVLSSIVLTVQKLCQKCKVKLKRILEVLLKSAKRTNLLFYSSTKLIQSLQIEKNHKVRLKRESLLNYSHLWMVLKVVDRLLLLVQQIAQILLTQPFVALVVLIEKSILVFQTKMVDLKFLEFTLKI